MRRKTRPRYYTRRHRRRPTSSNWIPLLVLVSLGAFIVWTIMQLFTVLFSGETTKTSSATVTILDGRGQFKLLEAESPWGSAFSGQTFVEGDRIRTNKNSRLQLTFWQNHHLVLGSETEIQLTELRDKKNQNLATFKLEKGQLWGYTPNATIGNPYQIDINSGQLSFEQAIFNLEANSEGEKIQMIAGQATFTLKHPPNQQLTLGVGQQLELNETTFNLIAQDQEAIEVLEADFIGTDWHRQNLEVFDPAAAKALAPPAPPVVQSQAASEESDDSTSEKSTLATLPSLILTSPDGSQVPSNPDHTVVIKGTAPEGLDKIEVNNYTLKRFSPGDRSWTYIAAGRFGTLKTGSNTFNVVGYDRSGQQTPTLEVTFDYLGTPPDSFTPATETSLGKVFPAPTIMKPAIFAEAPDAVYETSAPVVTISGNVPFGTNAVEVNNFRLRKFTSGQTEFAYIANANYGNLKEGENLFTVQAFGPDGQSSQTAIKIYYNPLITP